GMSRRFEPGFRLANELSAYQLKFSRQGCEKTGKFAVGPRRRCPTDRVSRSLLLNALGHLSERPFVDASHRERESLKMRDIAGEHGSLQPFAAVSLGDHLRELLTVRREVVR